MKIPILLYHSISTQAAPSYRPWALPPEEFEAHVAYLLDHGYTPMTVSSLVQIIKSDKKNFPKLPVVITFDDGLAAPLTTGSLEGYAMEASSGAGQLIRILLS